MGDVFFPIISADQAQMATVRCDCQDPKDDPAGRALVLARDEQEIERILADARATEAIGAEIARPIWVRFIPRQFSGRSYGLALALADKLARYRQDRKPRGGRWFATGIVVRDGSGEVGGVDGFKEKLAAITEEAGSGDIVVLPKANTDTADRTVLMQLDLLASRNVSWHSIDHLSEFEEFRGQYRDVESHQEDIGEKAMGITTKRPDRRPEKIDNATTASSRRRELLGPWHMGAAMIFSCVVVFFWPFSFFDWDAESQRRLSAEHNAGQAEVVSEEACENSNLSGCMHHRIAGRDRTGLERGHD